MSPSSSASSPPRGLAEAYRRIEDDELIAGQEDDSMDDVVGDDNQFAEDEESRGEESSHLGSTVDVDSPLSRKSSRRPSPRPPSRTNTEPDEAIHEEDNTQSSGAASSMSTPQNLEDDTFRKRRAQHIRDEERIKNLLRSDLQPFRKARGLGKASLTTENLRRSNASTDSGSSTLGSDSISSRASEPSMNVPREWGRKGRTANWLSRIDRKSGRFTGDVSRVKTVEADYSEKADNRRSSEPLVDWISAAAEVPLPSVENDGSAQRERSQDSTPASIIARPSSLRSIREWDIVDDDFTARSLQISNSPPIRIKKSTLDRVRDREIESLEKSAVTTNRLGELQERRSLENIKRRPPSVVADDERVRNHERSSSRRRSSDRSSLVPEIKEDDEPEEAALKAIADEMAIFKAVVNDEILRPPTDTEIKKDLQPEIQRPGHDRQDSRDILRKLARMSSASPSPNAVNAQRNHISSNPNATTNAGEARRDLLLSSQTESIKPDEAEQPLESDESTPVPHIEQTPQQRPSWDELKTPLVTGAWINTPLPSSNRGGPLMPTPADGDDENKNIGSSAGIHSLSIQEPYQPVQAPKTETTRPSTHPVSTLLATAPILPKSALLEVLAKAKRKNAFQTQTSKSHDNNNFLISETQDLEDEVVGGEGKEGEDTLHLDNSTIQSLEDLVASSDETIDLSVPLSLTTNGSSPPSPGKEPQLENPVESAMTIKATSQQPKAKARAREISGYRALTSRLSKVGISIKDAKLGLASLERAVSNVPDKTSSSNASLVKKGKSKNVAAEEEEEEEEEEEGECIEAGEFHDFIWPCSRCGCGFSSNPTTNRTIIRRLDDITKSTTQESSLYNWHPLSIPIPKLWTWTQYPHNKINNQHRNRLNHPKPTPLGLLTLLAWLVLFAELYARNKYCHPIHYTIPNNHLPAHLANHPFGINPHAPRPPFVLLKVLNSETPLGYILTPAYYLLCGVVKVVAAVVGWIVGFVGLGLTKTNGEAELSDQQVRELTWAIKRNAEVWGPGGSGPPKNWNLGAGGIFSSFGNVGASASGFGASSLSSIAAATATETMAAAAAAATNKAWRDIFGFGNVGGGGGGGSGGGSISDDEILS